MSTGRGEADTLTLLLHAGLLKRFVEFYIHVGKCAEEIPYCILQEKNLLETRLFLREDKGMQAVWCLEFVLAPTPLGFSCRSPGFCRGPRKLHLMIQYLHCLSEKKLSENKKTHQKQSSRQAETSLCIAEHASLCSETL